MLESHNLAQDIEVSAFCRFQQKVLQMSLTSFLYEHARAESGKNTDSNCLHTNSAHWGKARSENTFLR